MNLQEFSTEASSYSETGFDFISYNDFHYVPLNQEPYKQTFEMNFNWFNPQLEEQEPVHSLSTIQKAISKKKSPMSSPTWTVRSSINKTSLSSPRNEDSLENKNIVKNYSNAIAAFAITVTAIPYLKELAQELNVRVSQFQAFVTNRKKKLTSIEAFKDLLVINNNDSELDKAFKIMFKRISEVFVKYFSVNWIFSGKLQYKQAHLKYRFKMLRRIRDPSLFSNTKGKL